MLSQLANINCITAHHLTDNIFKKTQDKTSIAMSCAAQTPWGRKTAHQGQRQLLQTQSLHYWVTWTSWTSDITYLHSCGFKAIIDLKALLPGRDLMATSLLGIWGTPQHLQRSGELKRCAERVQEHRAGSPTCSWPSWHTTAPRGRNQTAVMRNHRLHSLPLSWHTSGQDTAAVLPDHSNNFCSCWGTAIGMCIVPFFFAEWQFKCSNCKNHPPCRRDYSPKQI